MEEKTLQPDTAMNADIPAVDIPSAALARYGSIMSGIRRALDLPAPAPDESATMREVYKTLSAVDTSGNIKKKQGLSYLSWARAWELVMSIYPDSTYDVITFDGKPYFDDPSVGCTVYTIVTISGVTRFMWLPVMDMRNKPLMRARQGGMDVMQLNKTIMRCLVKNLAVFGLGLNLYYGEDISDAAREEVDRKAQAAQQLDEARKRIIEIVSALPREQIEAARAVIAGHNGGERNPRKIKDIETCRLIIEELTHKEEK